MTDDQLTAKNPLPKDTLFLAPLLMPLADSNLRSVAPQSEQSPLLLEGKPSGLPSTLTDSWQNADPAARPPDARQLISSAQQVLYVLQQNRSLLRVDVLVARPLQSGGYGIHQEWSLSRLETSKADCVSEDDRGIASLLRSGKEEGAFPDDPEILDRVLRGLIGTGRAYFHSKDNPPLRLGDERTADIAWHLQSDATQTVGLCPPGCLEALSCARPWYIDKSSWESGPLRFNLPKRLVAALWQAPPVAPTDAQAVSARLKSLAGDVNVPLPSTDVTIQTVIAPPKLVLRLLGRCAWVDGRERFLYPMDCSNPFRLARVPHASVQFDYDGKQFHGDETEHRSVDGNKLIIRKRDLKAEAEALNRLTNLGLIKLLDYDNRSENLFSLPRHEASLWLCFMDNHIDQLRQSGWQIEIDDSFPFRTVTPDEGDYWTVEATEGHGFWFSVDLGIKVQGKRVPLLPVLVSALKAIDRKPTLETIDKLNCNGQFLAPMADGLISLPFERVRSILTTVLELLTSKKLGKEEKLSISLMQATQLAELAAKNGWLWQGPERLNEITERLRSSKGIQPLDPPPEFRTTLRDYQKTGLGWLQFLKQFNLGGILADDMGLGKTVQALAHLCIEKANGNLNVPALIVCPTSVLPNWIKETQRFAPHLKIVSLYGSGREGRRDDALSADIAITTYALLRHDLSWLAKQTWSNLILDEAQAIKNCKTATAMAAKSLRATQRICLTGTPVENKLTELWSHFDFLMPGILGTHKDFSKTFQTPIEQLNDQVIKRSLATRVRPFVLRRSKEQVAAELPEKSQILQRFELEGDQRDLYETVRVIMHEKVMQAIATMGFDRSSVVILEALLRLKQVCCDPRLVKLPVAQGVNSSAKLSLLKEMLSELLQQDRRILLFSQFTSMLDLIVPELKAIDCSFVEIRGETKDRVTPVERFQNGEVPVFLLSLKAGGTGLNLTAADTVIHYDQWWNPAVENQATDRAHRIGQTKPVFVYKLLALGTIEDRILQLQEKKKRIADSIYEHEKDEKAGKLLFDESDLELLLKPIS